MKINKSILVVLSLLSILLIGGCATTMQERSVISLYEEKFSKAQSINEKRTVICDYREHYPFVKCTKEINKHRESLVVKYIKEFIEAKEAEYYNAQSVDKKRVAIVELYQEFEANRSDTEVLIYRDIWKSYVKLSDEYSSFILEYYYPQIKIAEISEKKIILDNYVKSCLSAYNNENMQKMTDEYLRLIINKAESDYARASTIEEKRKVIERFYSSYEENIGTGREKFYQNLLNLCDRMADDFGRRLSGRYVEMIRVASSIKEKKELLDKYRDEMETAPYCISEALRSYYVKVAIEYNVYASYINLKKARDALDVLKEEMKSTTIEGREIIASSFISKISSLYLNEADKKTFSIEMAWVIEERNKSIRYRVEKENEAKRLVEAEQQRRIKLAEEEQARRMQIEEDDRRQRRLAEAAERERQRQAEAAVVEQQRQAEEAERQRQWQQQQAIAEMHEKIRQELFREFDIAMKDNKQKIFDQMHPIGTAKSLSLHTLDVTKWRGDTPVELSCNFTVYWEGPITTDGYTKATYIVDCDSKKITRISVNATNGLTNKDAMDISTAFVGAMLEGAAKRK